MLQNTEQERKGKEATVFWKGCLGLARLSLLCVICGRFTAMAREGKGSNLRALDTFVRMHGVLSAQLVALFFFSCSLIEEADMIYLCGEMLQQIFQGPGEFNRLRPCSV